MYTFDSRIRYSECDYREKLNIYGMINYFQDCSTFQSESTGAGVLAMHEQNLVWVVSFWQIDVFKYPQLGDKVTVGTFPYDYRGFFGKRNFFMKDENGEFLAKADSLWTLLNYETSKPERVTEEIAGVYGLGDKLDMDYEKGKILPLDTMEEKSPITVMDSHLDANMHVNNGQFVGMIMNLIETADYKRLKVEYRKMARKGEILIPYVGNDDNKTIVILKNKDNDVCSAMEFIK